MNFLKPKKRQKEEGKTASQLSVGQLPPLPTESELYSELPNLPEAPETSGLPEIELPPLKGLDGFELPEMEEEAGEEVGGKEAELPKEEDIFGKAEKVGAEPLLPNWPETPVPTMSKQKEGELHEQPERQPLTALPEIPQHVPEVKPFAPELKKELVSGLVSFGSNFYLSANNFGMVMEDFDSMVKMQKKHHKLTELKKEENQHYEQANMLFEEVQRKLMFIDKTLFE